MEIKICRFTSDTIVFTAGIVSTAACIALVFFFFASCESKTAEARAKAEVEQAKARYEAGIVTGNERRQ